MSEKISPNPKDEINIVELLIPIWKARKRILVTAIIFAVLGAIEGFLTPISYSATSTFLPQTADSGGSSNLGGIAALAGISLNTSVSDGDISPNLYQKFLASEPFRKRILDSKILINGDSVTYREYLKIQLSSPNRTIVSTLMEYTLGLPEKLIGLVSGLLASKEEVKEASPKDLKGIQPLSDQEYGLLNTVLGKVNIFNNTKEGVVSITVVENDPIIASQINLITEKVLQDWIREQKIKKAQAQYEFVEKQFETKQNQFFSIQDRLAGYMDKNQNVSSVIYLTRLNRLQAEFDLANSIYSELAKQKEQAAIQLSKETPTFFIIDPVKVPKKKSSPNIKNYILGGFFIGFFISLGWVLIQKPIISFWKVLIESK